jgi:hypothetical protein
MQAAGHTKHGSTSDYKGKYDWRMELQSFVGRIPISWHQYTWCFSSQLGHKITEVWRKCNLAIKKFSGKIRAGQNVYECQYF